MKHFFRFFTILLVITFSISAKESYGQDQNGLYLSVVKQIPPSSSIIEICSGENIALYGNTSGTAVERLIFEFYNKNSKTWEVLSSTFRNFDFSNVGAFAFKEALPDNIESQEYRLRYFINQVEYTTPSFSINVRPGSSAGGISPRTYTICYGSTPPDLTLLGTVGTNFRWQSSITSSAGTYTDMTPAVTTATLPGSTINNYQTGYYRVIVQNSYCTPDTLSVPITVTVTALNTIGLSSAVGTESQTVCISTPITNLTFATTGATGATSTTLPTGLSGSWSAGVFTVSGTPTVAGTYSFTITTSGGCGVVSTTASLVVTPNNTIRLSSASGTDVQTVCINTAITSVAYTTEGATNATFAGLPAGVDGAWLNNVVTISGTPTASGTFTYTITLTGGCGVITKTGTIKVNALNTIGLSSAVGTESQIVCISTPITNLTYATITATGATSTTLPAGLNGSWSAGVYTVSGTPTVAGTYSFTITTTGGCGVASTTASLVVTPNNTITQSSASGTDSQTVCINTAITSVTYTTTGATGATFAGLPAGVDAAWSSNVVTISGTPTASGTFTYTITLAGGCGVITKTGTIVVTPNNTIALSSAAGTNAQTVCINGTITNIRYTTTIASGATVTGLPTGLTYGWSANALTISGTVTVAGTYTYTATTTGGCSVASATGTIVITAANTIGLSSAVGTESQTVCISTPIANLTFATTGATGATSTTLPTGLTGLWSAGVFTVSGTPTVAGTYSFTVTTSGGCGVATTTASLVVTPNNTITLSSATGTDSQTVCINTAITSVTYTTTGATNATFAGLPAGVDGAWLNNIVTISGTPTVSGTYNYTITLTGGCGIITKNGIIVVSQQSVAGNVAITTGSSTICSNSSKPIITLSGNTGLTIKWQSSLDGTNFSDISPAQTERNINNAINNIASGNTQVVTYYLASVQSGACPAVSTSPVSITVDPIPQLTAIVSNEKTQQVCIGISAIDVNLTTNVGTIVWKYSSTSGSGYLPFSPNQTNSRLSNSVINTNNAGTTYYKAFVTSGVCAAVQSDEVVVKVDAETVAGSIASTSNLICNGSTPPTISLTGNTGSTIQWQTRLASASYVNPIPSQNGTSISSVVNNSAPASSQVVNYYQAIVKSGACNSLTTNEVMVAIDPTSQVSPITLAQKVQQWCIGSPATAVTLPGYTGTIIWKTATSIGGTYNTIGGETTATLPAANIPTTAAGVLYYKAVVTSGVCPSAESEIVSVQTDALTVAGSIASTSNLICNGSTPPTISLTGNTGSTIKWQTRLASATYVDPIPSQTGSSISSVVNNSAPASSQVVNYYQAIVKSGACNPLTTNEVAVAVDPSSQVGLIEPLQKNQEICIGSSATSVVLPSHTGTIQWQTANLGGSYTDMTGLTNATLLFGNIATNVSGTKIYRAQVTSGVCPAIYSEIATVQVDATTVAGDAYFLNGNSSICNLGDKPTISIKNNTGTNIVWQITTVSNSNSVIGTANSLSYTNTNNTGNLLNSGIDNTASGAISSFKYYRASVRNGVCKTEFTQPIELEVIPTPIVTKVVPAERCGLGNVEILAESNLGIPNWFEANSGGAAIVSANTFITPLLNSSTNYYAGAIFRGCVSFDRTAVLAKIKPIPSVTSVINANNCGPGNLELSATVSGGIVNWFADANAGSSLLTATKYTTPSISNTTTYYAEALLDGCTSSPRTPVVATIFEVPTFKSLPDLFSLCAGLRLSLNNYVALGAPPYNYIFNTNNGNVMGQKDGYLLGVKGGITDVYFNVKDMNGCISQNTNSFQVKTYDPVKPKIFFQEAFYDFSTIIKTKVDSGYSVYDWSPMRNLDFYNDKDPVFRGINNVTYALYRLDTTSNCSVTDTYNITVTTDFIFDLPNAFTPNFDGLNDVIKSMYNSGIASLNFLRIYNRNGNIVFQTSLLSEGWDGRVNGVDQDADAYYWTAEYVTRKSETFRKTGSFLLIK